MVIWRGKMYGSSFQTQRSDVPPHLQRAVILGGSLITIALIAQLLTAAFVIGGNLSSHSFVFIGLEAVYGALLTAGVYFVCKGHAYEGTTTITLALGLATLFGISALLSHDFSDSKALTAVLAAASSLQLAIVFYKTVSDLYKNFKK